MKTKSNKSILSALFIAVIGLSACTKSECHECHYEVVENGVESEVELGEKCDEELESLEANGYTAANGTTYEVHCHEH